MAGKGKAGFEALDGAAGRPSYRTRDHRVMEVEIDGRMYRAELGNLTFALEAAEIGKKMRAIGEPGIDPGEMIARAEDFSNSVRAMAAEMFGEEAAGELVGGAHRLDILRIADVVRIMADIARSDESISAAREAFGA